MRINFTRYLASFVVIGLTLVSVGSAGSAGVSPIATLNGDSNVTVNGKPVKVAQPAFAGDTIEAPGSALGIIHFPEQGLARLSASARASIEQSGKELWLGLQRGYVGIHEGNQPVSVRAHGGKISAGPGAVFEVAQLKDGTYVTAIKGSAVISEGGLEEPQSVAQGQSVKVAFLEPGPLMGLGLEPQGSAAPAQLNNNTTTCKDLKDQCKKDPTTCKVYERRCRVCHDPCKGKDKNDKECVEFHALQKQCTPLRKACAADPSKCSDYGRACVKLAGCVGFGGVLEAQFIPTTASAGCATYTTVSGSGGGIGGGAGGAGGATGRTGYTGATAQAVAVAHIAAAADNSTCKDLRDKCNQDKNKDSANCKVYDERCKLCSDPCRNQKDNDKKSRACLDFLALEKSCVPLRQACAADPNQCAEYGRRCTALRGCAGAGAGILEAQALPAAGGNGCLTPGSTPGSPGSGQQTAGQSGGQGNQLPGQNPSQPAQEAGQSKVSGLGTAGVGGVGAAGAAGGAGAAGAAGAASAAGAAGSAAASTAAGAAAAASSAASAGAAGAAAAAAGAAAAGTAAVTSATVSASTAAGASIGTVVSVTTSPQGCPAGTVAVAITTGVDAGQFNCIVSH
jgi:hypothetical protein